MNLTPIRGEAKTSLTSTPSRKERLSTARNTRRGSFVGRTGNFDHEPALATTRIHLDRTDGGDQHHRHSDVGGDSPLPGFDPAGPRNRAARRPVHSALGHRSVHNGQAKSASVAAGFGGR